MCAKVGIYIYTQNTHLHKFAKFWGAVIRRKTVSIGDGERGDCAKKRLRALKKGHKKGANCGMGRKGLAREDGGADKYLQNFFANKREENIANPKKSA